MSVSSRQQGAARRRAARRRKVRRSVALVTIVVLAVIGVTAVPPLFQKAIRLFTLPLQYSTIIRQQAREQRVDAALIAAVIDTETGFDARTSPTGAEGLMQIEPATATFLARRSGGTSFNVNDLGQPQVNIEYGTYYLAYLLNNYGGDETAALSAYNGGQTNTDRWIIKAHAGGHAFGLGDIPFPQTRAYVQTVEKRQLSYRANYPVALGYR
jgi:peptidoglycan lytic transglycosylase